MRVNVDSAAACDPRFKRCAKELGINWREALGSAVLVWLVCYDRRSSTLPEIDIDIAAELDGFARSLVNAGLASDVEGAVRIHGVSDRIGFLGENAERASKGGRESGKTRRAKKKEREAVNEASASNARSKRFGDHEATPEAVLEPYSPDLDQAPDLSPDLDQAPSLDPQIASRPVAARPVEFFRIPTIGNGEFVVTVEMVAEWKSTYPGIDVEHHLRQARQWLLDNPAKRKTTGGARRYFGSWLGRANDSGRHSTVATGGSRASNPTGVMSEEFATIRANKREEGDS